MSSTQIFRSVLQTRTQSLSDLELIPSKPGLAPAGNSSKFREVLRVHTVMPIVLIHLIKQLSNPTEIYSKFESDFFEDRKKY